MKNFYTDNLYYTTVALSREIASIAETSFMDLGLTPSDAYLVMVVNEKPGVQPTEISEKILLAPSTITRMIEKLEKRSIVTRMQEGKYTFVKPTEKGVEIYQFVLKKWQEINHIYLTKLSEPTVEMLIVATSEAVAKLK